MRLAFARHRALAPSRRVSAGRVRPARGEAYATVVERERGW